MKSYFPLHPGFKIFTALLFAVLVYFEFDFAATIVLLIFIYTLFYNYRLTDQYLEIPFLFFSHRIELKEILAVSSFRNFRKVYRSVYGKRPWLIPLGNVIVFVSRPWLGGGIVLFTADSDRFMAVLKKMIKRKVKKKR